MKNLKKWQKITLVAALAAVVAGAAGVTAYCILNNNNEAQPVATSSDFTGDATELVLKDGKNKITSGGIYHITGSTSEGSIVVETTAEVKLILDNVSVTNTSGAAVHVKSTGSVLIELVGENNLTSSNVEEEDQNATISAKSSLSFDGSGTLSITSTGKGIKADGNLAIFNGALNIEADDDTIHSNSDVEISGGTLALSSGDDGVHADNSLTISGGKVDIKKSYEGLEGDVITISGGEVSVVASDDGINAATSSEAEGNDRQGFGQGNGSSKLIISGGTVYVNSVGDGLDSNGDIEISGGTTYVDGPTSDGDGALDYDGEMTITGGTLIATGSSGMAMNASSATQPSVLINLSSRYSGTLSFGGLEFTPTKSYASVLVSSPNLKTSQTYDLVIGGSTVQSVSVESNITGEGNGMMGGPGMMNGGGQGQNQGQGGPGGRR